MTRCEPSKFWRDMYDAISDPEKPPFEEFVKECMGPDPTLALQMGINRAFGIGPCPRNKLEFGEMLENPEVQAQLQEQVDDGHKALEMLRKHGPIVDEKIVEGYDEIDRLLQETGDLAMEEKKLTGTRKDMVAERQVPEGYEEPKAEEKSEDVDGNVSE
jgi:hypothetical protein